MLLYWHMSLKDAVLAVISSGLVSHLVFKRWEPTNLGVLAALLVLSPAAISTVFLPHYGYFKALAASFFIYTTTLLTSIVVYRLSPIHPLARYPGPIPLKLSKFWLVWIVKQGKQHLYIQDLHKKYGDVVRIGPNEISIRDASVIYPLLGTQGLPKGPSWLGRTLYPPVLPLIAHRDPVKHARRRKPWNRALSTTALKEYQPFIAKRVKQLIERLTSRRGNTADLSQWISFFAYDFMGDAMFGGGTELLRDGDRDGLWETLEHGLDTAIVFEHMPWLAPFAKRVPGFGHNLKSLRAMALDRTTQRYKNGSDCKDLFYYLSNEDGAENTSPSPAVVISDGVLALVAGAHTTSSVLSNLFYLLLRHPQVYTRLRVEIDEFYAPGDDATNPKHYPKMPYLDAVINETLRLYPAVPGGIQRAPMVGMGDRTIGPYYLPEGTQARIHVYSIHHDPRNFSRPETFWPERWLIADGLHEHPFTSDSMPAEKLTHNVQAFIPFSFGPANCVGKNLAMQEMRVFVCCFVHGLDLHFAKGWNPLDWERELQDMHVMKVGRLPVVIQQRTR